MCCGYVVALGLKKMGFSPFGGCFVLMYTHSEAPLFPVNTLFLVCSYIIQEALLPHVDFFLCPPSSVDINTQYVTAGCAPTPPQCLSLQKVKLLFYCNGNHVCNILTYYIHSNTL